MASYVMKYLFKRNVPDLKFGANPYFEEGDTQRKKFKAVPAQLSKNDTNILKKVRRRAYRLDECITCCCCSFRIGWSSVIGLIPLIGDVIDLAFAYGLIKEAKKIDGGLPDAIVAQMYSNLVVDFVVGLIPLVGDIADMAFKANTRNLQMLEKQLMKTTGQVQPSAPVAAGSSQAPVDYGTTTHGQVTGTHPVPNQQPFGAQTQGRLEV
ncbi:hypothetical protein BCR37DRAFT_406972 [Protomyces lactucae-debilis]|uniref:PH domain-containing protein n=1 Tax=Protomyces lactucae-debilis TaxID=2754530 RepID=A0A1Y2FRI0_PROLT|nr:uncharacterized protein BCR37DRAFT_406972 [Protomyces lactucae-debilis]ORY86187.1 hypothetical protein BCR37DRAFT_406972 [Protomyces lactucae-debilis]